MLSKISFTVISILSNFEVKDKVETKTIPPKESANKIQEMLNVLVDQEKNINIVVEDFNTILVI